MKNNTVSQIILVLMLVVSVGCRMGTIYNVEGAAIAPGSGKRLTQDEVTTVIVNAGAKYGWAMSVAKPGHIIGTLSLRSHKAVVDITYTTTSYNITYKNSENLKYNPSTNSIHANYSTWIKRLQVSIQNAVGAL